MAMSERPRRVKGHEVHCLVRRIDRQVGAELALESGNQLVALISVQQAHAAICAAKWPSSMKAATTAWLKVDGCRSIK